MPALDGMRVLDMTQYEAGTSCTQWLAWLGADVVKVESPSGDPGRGVARTSTGDRADGQYFMNYNGNKRSIVVNLKDAAGRQLLLDLVRRFDVFVENYGPGVVEKLGIGYDALRERAPSLVYGRIKGFGLSGPYAAFNSYDWVAQAAAGTFSVTGDPDGPPMRPGASFADSGTGLQMALAITAAYVQQQRTGEGQLIELSMQEAVTMFMRTLGLQAWGREAAPRTGIGRGTSSTYPCRGGGRNDWVYIMPVTVQMWDALVATMGRTDFYEDDRFATWEARQEHTSELYDEIAAWTRQYTKQEVMEILGAAGVPCSKVFDTLDLFTDAHLQARGFVQTVEHPVNGPVQLWANPVRMSESNVPVGRSPLLGEHTDAVLNECLGLSEADITALRESGVVG
ncbi:MAG: formyl-CoA transferase [Dehalococcoidia bacterium]|nr:formyl-CoA transferase [Dehalococcoidia bacterium]